MSMPPVSLHDFNGEFPRTLSHLLPNNAAQLAVDCDFTVNALSGINDVSSTTIPVAAGAKSIFVYDTDTSNTLFSWKTDVNAVRGPVADDKYHRFYWSDGNNVYVSDGTVPNSGGQPALTNTWLAGVPQPVEKLAIENAGFNISGESDFTFTAICEAADGTISNETALTPIVDESTQTRYKAHFDVAFSCGVGGTDTKPSGVALYYVGTYYPTVQQIVDDGSGTFSWKINMTSEPVSLYSDSSDVIPLTSALASLLTGAIPELVLGDATLYFHHADWANRSFGSGESPVYVAGTAFYSIGYGWYASREDAAPPTSGNLSGAASATPALKVKVGDYEIILREGTGASTWPSDLTGFTGTVTFESGSITVDIFQSSTYVTTRYYTYCYVNGFGEVGPPADAVELEVTEGQSVTLTIPAVMNLTGGAYTEQLQTDWDNFWATAQVGVPVVTDIGTFVVTGTGTATFTDLVGTVFTFTQAEGPEGLAAKSQAYAYSIHGNYGTGTYKDIGKIFLYRTATGTQGTAFLLVPGPNEDGSISVGGSPVTFVDDKRDSALAEPLSTLDYYPPEPGLTGLVALPNGILAAFRENEVHFSEPYLPYAWKAANIQTTGHNVVGVCPMEGGLCVTTVEHPYIISGLNPDAMAQIKVSAVQAGVSKGSICNIGPVVAYASNDGIVTGRGTDFNLDWSFRFFTRDEWRKRFKDKLAMMRFNAHDGHLVVWFTDGTPGFLMRYDETDVSFTRLSFPIYAAVVYPIGDALYISTNGNYVTEFKGNPTANKLFSWWSKDWIAPKPGNYGCIQLVGKGTVKYTVYADGEQKDSETVVLTDTGMSVSRLPAGFLARRWSVKFDAQSVGALLTEFTLAVSPMELQGG